MCIVFEIFSNKINIRYVSKARENAGCDNSRFVGRVGNRKIFHGYQLITNSLRVNERLAVIYNHPDRR